MEKLDVRLEMLKEKCCGSGMGGLEKIGFFWKYVPLIKKEDNMKNNYEGFVKHIDELERNNVAYTKRDMYRIAKKYNVVPCDEECWLFRWSRCNTKNKDGLCDKPDRRENALETNGGKTGFDG